MKEYFDKELVMTKKKMKILKTLINIGFFIMLMLIAMLLK